MSLSKLKARALENPEVKIEYERLEAEFSLADKLISMRAKAEVTPEMVKKMVNPVKHSL